MTYNSPIGRGIMAQNKEFLITSYKIVLNGIKFTRREDEL